MGFVKPKARRQGLIKLMTDLLYMRVPYMIRLVSFVAIAVVLSLAGCRSSKKAASNEKEAIQWITFEEAAKLNSKDRKEKKVMIDMYTSWCGWCKKMDKTTFSDPLLIEYINANYYAVKFDAEQKATVKFNGKEYQFVDKGRRGYHELAAELMQGRMSYPTLVFMNEDMELIQAIPGYRGAPELDRIVKYFGGDHHKTTDYTTFNENYTSPYAD